MAYVGGLTGAPPLAQSEAESVEIAAHQLHFGH
jgi:hypothetical protein